MVGNTLYDIRRQVESLATEDGTFYVVCGRTGTSPAPVAGKRFDSRTVAQSALRIAEQYRSALRRYDPHLPYHDLIVCETPTNLASTDRPSPLRQSPPSIGDGTITDSQPLIDFCHDVTGALFEALALKGYGTVERAVMDVYLNAAESITDRDEFCLVLLESMVVELSARLSDDEQRLVLSAAADRLPPMTAEAVSIETVLQHLVSVSIATDYRLFPLDDALPRRDWLVTLTDYALDEDDRFLPTLPLAIRLGRISPGSMSIRWARAVGAHDWQLRLRIHAADVANGSGLLRTTIRDG